MKNERYNMATTLVSTIRCNQNITAHNIIKLEHSHLSVSWCSLVRGFLASRRGWPQRALLVSTGLVDRYSGSHDSWQSHTKGFIPRCLWEQRRPFVIKWYTVGTIVWGYWQGLVDKHWDYDSDFDHKTKPNGNNRHKNNASDVVWNQEEKHQGEKVLNKT